MSSVLTSSRLMRGPPRQIIFAHCAANSIFTTSPRRLIVTTDGGRVWPPLRRDQDQAVSRPCEVGYGREAARTDGRR